MLTSITLSERLFDSSYEEFKSDHLFSATGYSWCLLNVMSFLVFDMHGGYLLGVDNSVGFYDYIRTI